MSKFYSKISKKHEPEIYTLEEFDSLPEKPGLYSWHVLCGETTIKNYHSLFKQKFYNTKIQGFLKEEYQGKVSSIAAEFDFEKIDENLIRIASAFFSPSIYVGIAKSNLRQRLSSHKHMLSKLLNSDEDEDKTSDSIGDAEIDSEKESKYFAGRISNIIRSTCKDLNESNFFIKVLAVDISTPVESIKNTEFYLNRTFNPLLGRR